MCRRDVESWSCGCEVGTTTPCAYPSQACRYNAVFAPRLEHPYACPECTQSSISSQFVTARPTTSPRKRRSPTEDWLPLLSPGGFAQTVTEKRLSRPAALDLNLSMTPKRQRTSRDRWSSDAPQLIGRRNNALQAIDEVEMFGRMDNPADALADIAMPGALPAM